VTTDSDRHYDVDPDPDELEVELSVGELLAAAEHCARIREQQLRDQLEMFDWTPPFPKTDPLV
jgi:hypothetical protein